MNSIYDSKGDEVRDSRVFADVLRVIVENHDLCNRSCPFCINSKIDRKQLRTVLSEAVFIALLDQLMLGGFVGSFAFGRYHEPMVTDLIYERVRLAKSRLGKSFIYLNTNGDFVDTGSLRLLADSGLDEIKIMRYLPNGAQYQTEVAEAASLRFIEKNGLEVIEKRVSPGASVYYMTRLRAVDLRISVRCENYRIEGIGADRGGLIPGLGHGTRSKPCYAPRYEINVDANGAVMPCCNLLSTVTSHSDFVLGNIHQTTLAEIWTGSSAEAFRNAVGINFPRPSPCHSCSYYWPASKGSGQTNRAEPQQADGLKS